LYTRLTVGLNRSGFPSVLAQFEVVRSYGIYRKAVHCSYAD